MAARKTRVKLRFQVEKAVADIDRALGHLQNLDDLNAGRHYVVNTQLPLLVEMLDNTRKVFKRFREIL